MHAFMGKEGVCGSAHRINCPSRAKSIGFTIQMSTGRRYRQSMHFSDPLPIDDVLEPLLLVLAQTSCAVLVAPPGAGKTTRVPLAILEAPWAAGKRILLLEPRRLAARAAADRLASHLNCPLGGVVGLRVRLENRIGPQTRLEVITEGIFTRMILDDPELADVAAVIFDEFHERSLDADFGLALALEAQQNFNPALRLLVMSATLDSARVADLLKSERVQEVPVIESAGRSYPVETRYRPRDPQQPVEDAVFSCILETVQEDEGSILVFLPGQAEITRVAARLSDRYSDDPILIAPLFGVMDPHAQDQAIKPCPAGRRKIVLATSIAETSLTIEDVRIVIDSGLSRVPRYEPDLGLTRLETVRVSRASADQRRGRAGRVAAGVAYRLWSEAADGALEPFQKPEILTSDLSSLLLDCAAWGEQNPRRLAFLDPPPEPALKEAGALLTALGAFDASGRITSLGSAIRSFGLSPRLATMIMRAETHGQAAEAALLSALLSERGFGGDDIDLAHRFERAQRDPSPRAKKIKRLAADWAQRAHHLAKQDRDKAAPALSLGSLLAFAFPDRLAKARSKGGQFLLANGRAAQVPETSALAGQPWLVVAEIVGKAQAARIVSAVSITLPDIETHPAVMIETQNILSFDKQARAMRFRERRQLGAISVSERMLPVPQSSASAAVLAAGIAGLGLDCLPWTKALRLWCARIGFLRQVDATWPDLSEQALLKDDMDWLVPYLEGVTALEQALQAQLDHHQLRDLDKQAPAVFVAPTGQAHPIDYGGEQGPVLAIRVQELFGLQQHPALAGGKIPLTLHLLSPAHRPIQITRDLPGFWKGSWAAVKSEMKGRYPKHVWPDDPAHSLPTLRAKPRGS
jgi:ATP-dependent helicase HrpB